MSSQPDFLDQFSEDYSFRIDPETMKGYVAIIKQFLGFCEKPMDQISSKDVRSWLVYLEGKGRKRSTMGKNLIALRSVYQFGIDEGYLHQNPLDNVPSPHQEEKAPYYLRGEQLAHLRNLVQGNLNEKAVVEVLYTTGVRLHELLAINKADIDWSERMIMIRKGKGKKERIVLFTKEYAEIVKAYLATRNDENPSLFITQRGHNTPTKRAIQHRFEGYRTALGFHVSPHTLRHTFAAHLAQKGMPLAFIQVLLGHENANQTQTYARLYHDARKELYDEWM